MRVGILGGTFDPVHQGHLFLAREAKRLLQLDQVWLMVANISPLKKGQHVRSAFHRFAMAALAARRKPDLRLCDWELRRGGSSYTIDTLRFLNQRFPQHRFCFLAGGDSLREIHSWRDCDTLLKEHCFAFVPRPGVELDWSSLDFPALKESIRKLGSAGVPPLEGGHTYLLQLTPPPVSSTQIRRILESGGTPSAKHLPRSVYRYIQKHSLYEKQQT